MRHVVDLVAAGLGIGLVVLAVVTTVLVVRGRPPQPPPTRGRGAQVRGTWRRSWSYQRYVINEIRRGARGGRRR